MVKVDSYLSALLIASALCSIPEIWAEGVSPYQISLEPPADSTAAKDSDGAQSSENPETSKRAVPSEQSNPSAISDRSVDELLAQAQTFYNDEQYPQAIELLEPLIERAPERIDIWEVLGWSYWHTGQMPETIALWKDMSVIHGGNARAHDLLGKAYVATDQLDEAITAFQKSVEIDPENLQTLYTLGAVNRWAGKLKTAIAILGNCLVLNPNNGDTQLQLAKALMSSRLYEDAIPLWQKLLEKNPDDADIMGHLSKALLHKGKFDAAIEMAGNSLERDPNNIYALDVLATLATHLDEQSVAVEYRQRLLAAEDRPDHKIRILATIIEQDRIIWERRNGDYDMHNAVEAAEQLLDLQPNAIDTHILLGEILMLQGKYAQAADKLEYVLRRYNPNNIRVQRTLMEVYTAQKQYDKAEKLFAEMESFNPQDPYMHYFKSQLAFARGRYGEAFEELDRLERAGAQGAIAVLLYHGLSTSKFDTILTVERFEEQLRAFKDAGYDFITPLEIAEYFEYQSPSPRNLDDYTPERVVVVTFDDARIDALEHGTPIASKLGAVFAMHVPPPYVDGNNQFFADWEQLRQYQASGRWIFGSHLQNASDVALLDSQGTKCRPLPNRIWLPEEERKETLAEHGERIGREYADSYRELEENLGPDCAPDFVAYPYGDIGQQTISDVIDVVDLNLEQAAEHYDIGFIQSRFGYAVKGDDPLLYQRHEPRQTESGPQVLSQTIANHPVFLARRQRARYEALRGNSYAAHHMIELLERDQYPASELDDLRNYVDSRLTGKGNLIEPDGHIIDYRNWKPRLGGRVEHTRDNTDRNNLRMSVLADLRVLPNLEIGAFAGTGKLEQKYTQRETGQEIDLTVDEIALGGRIGYDIVTGDPLMSPIELGLQVGRRDFSGDAEHAETFYSANINASPRPPLNLNLFYEHDVIPWARSLTDQKSYDLIQAMANYEPADYWDLIGTYSNYDYSDDNSADHINLTSLWTLYPDWGLRAGLRYSYLTSDQDREDYWTPYKLDRYMALLEIRQRISRSSYRLQLRYGIGKDRPRPEEQQAFEENLETAIARNFTDLPKEPEEEWTQVYGFAAAIEHSLSERLTLRGELSFNKLPDYDETRALGALQYSF